MNNFNAMRIEIQLSIEYSKDGSRFKNVKYGPAAAVLLNIGSRLSPPAVSWRSLRELPPWSWERDVKHSTQSGR